jgi:hypothetical protein
MRDAVRGAPDRDVVVLLGERGGRREREQGGEDEQDGAHRPGSYGFR